MNKMDVNPETKLDVFEIMPGPSLNIGWFNARKIILDIKKGRDLENKMDTDNDNEFESDDTENTILSDISDDSIDDTSTDSSYTRSSNKYSNSINEDSNDEVEIVQIRDNNFKNCENARFSNNMKDVVKTVCKICMVAKSTLEMRSHTKKMHGVNIRDYKQQFGELGDHLIEIVLHKCGVCNETLLFSHDVISGHVRSKHKISCKTYSQKYTTRARLKKKKLQ